MHLFLVNLLLINSFHLLIVLLIVFLIEEHVHPGSKAAERTRMIEDNGIIVWQQQSHQGNGWRQTLVGMVW